MKGPQGGFGVIGALAAGLTLLGTLAVGCGGGGGNVFIPLDTIGGDEDGDEQQQTYVVPAPRSQLAAAPGVAFRPEV